MRTAHPLPGLSVVSEHVPTAHSVSRHSVSSFRLSDSSIGRTVCSHCSDRSVSAFGELATGGIIGAVFFGTVAIAALSSAISLTEVVVSYAVDERGATRFQATVGICTAMFVLGLAPAYDIVLLELYDDLADGVLLVLGGLLLAIYVSWAWADEAIEELGKGIGPFGNVGLYWIWLVRIPVAIVLIVALGLGISDYATFLSDDFLPWVQEL